jgi:tripeptide aminopeptidase
VTTLFASEALALFLDLAAIPSPSGSERPVAERVAAELRALGLSPELDDSGERIASDTGNVYARLAPAAAGTPVFFCAHLDTVVPLGPIEPVVEDGTVRNAAGTILGADDKAAVAVMLEAVRRILAENRPHPGIELVFTTREETGCQGAAAFDEKRLHSHVGFVYDHQGPIGDVVVAAPYQRSIDVTFRGRAAHAGINPEDGRSAVQAAARAIAELRLGRIDDETTANVGRIAGGSARNVVPEVCTLTAEARSRDEAKLLTLVQEMVDTFAFAAAICDCDVETRLEELYRGYRLSPNNPALTLATAALERSGCRPRPVEVGGGADANVFNGRGLSCVVLANGMDGIHSPDEHIAVADLDRMVDVTLAIVEAALDS